MQISRKNLVANVETEFTFDSYGANSVVVKNETAGEILFCDGTFEASRAAHIPAFSWQSLNVSVHIGDTPKFTVKATASGPVEIDFGSSGMGMMGNMLDVAGMIPHTLTLATDDDTTLVAALTRLHGQTLDLDVPVPLTSGATVFNGDIILVTPSASAGYYAKITINGVSHGRLEAGIFLTISGETTIEAEAVETTARVLTLTPGENTSLSAEAIRLPGMLVDLVTPIPIATAETIYDGEIVRFTAATTEGEGYHVTLTVNDELIELTEGKADIVIDGDTTAVTASEGE